ncbi:hypothetical protein [Agarilytica rhodophyticola]|uniref:hypothetical protein n=1 Tax=Agarilytica rhodophyticola TaxID=1737490 RepID=UPI000B341735|nr:hypothetical protein [Agarilytica rhodophyticola]
MKCPNCKQNDLAPKELEKGLVGAGCTTCGGVLLPLMNYRYWQDIHSSSIEPWDETVEVKTEDSSGDGAKFCPKCNRFMSKYRIGLERDNRVELCANCDEAWLDTGEWQLLKCLDLHNHLPDIFTDAYQRELRKKQQREKWDMHFEKEIGAEDFERVRQFKIWLDDHDSFTEIKHYLNINFD